MDVREDEVEKLVREMSALNFADDDSIVKYNGMISSAGMEKWVDLDSTPGFKNVAKESWNADIASTRSNKVLEPSDETCRPHSVDEDGELHARSPVPSVVVIAEELTSAEDFAIRCDIPEASGFLSRAKCAL